MSSNPPLIALGVDLDEVVFRYIKAIREVMINSGYNPPSEDPDIFAMDKNGWFETLEEFKRLHGDAVDNSIYENLEMIENASEVLWDLKRSGYEINVVTSRFVNPGQNEKVVIQTARALEANNIPYSNLAFLSDKTRLLMDANLEDAPHNLIPLKKAGRYTIIFDMAYNRDIPGDRANTWHEAREILRTKFGR